MDDPPATKHDIKNLERTMLAGFADLRAAMEFGFTRHDARFDRLESRIEDLESPRKRR